MSMFGIIKKFLGSLVLVLLFTNALEAKNISFSKDFGTGVKVRVSSVGKPNLEHIGYKCLNGNEIKKSKK